jgi:hypothetical protein
MKIWKLSWMAGVCGFSFLHAADPAQLVFEKELAGDNSGRAQALEASAGIDIPDQIHWQRGEIRVDGEWVPYRRVVDQGDRWAELHRYREERAKKGAGVDDQFFLADGCRQHKLWDEERAHLHAVLVNDAENEEARQRLGHRKVEGVWVTDEDARTAQRGIEEQRNSFDQWGKRVERVVKQLSDRSERRRQTAQRDLAEIRDPSAIPVVETLLGRGNEQQQILFLTWVCELNSWRASAALARLATESESAVVRVKATQELKSRRPEEYVPTILGSMMTPISIRSTTQQSGDWVLYSQHAVSESQTRQYDSHYLARYSPLFLQHYVSLGVWSGIVSDAGTKVTQDPSISSAKDGKRAFTVLAQQSQAEVGDQNRNIDIWNDRCSRVLSEAVGVRGMSSPQDWWAWWEDDQGNLIASKDRVFAQYEEEWFVGRRRGPVTRRGVSPYMPFVGTGILLNSSCFVAGTPVMTEFGSKPIESIVRGDRVLSQDVETGELSFKPVFHTTIRTSPGSAVVKMEDDQLKCTPCHPFWVNGKGWRMARELAPGDRFHSINGAVNVTGVDAGEKVEVFNLHVGDFHTYFVGKNSVLTHDVTVRQPTDMALPGFAMETTAAVGAAK